MDEGRSWRLACIPGSGLFQLAPDDALEWESTTQEAVREENLIRDELTMPIVRELFGGYRDYIAAACDGLVSGPPERGPRRLLTAVIGHALAYTTWHSLVREQRLDNVQSAGLMCRLVAAAVEPLPKKR